MRKAFNKIIVFLLFFFITFPVVSASQYGWGFRRNSNNEIPDIGKYAEIIKDTNSYYVGPREKKIIYLTFDSGYDNNVLGKILDVLKEKKVVSTFFVTGDFVMREHALLKRIVNEGHIVGNHTWGHKNITKLNDEELRYQLEKVEKEFHKITNHHMAKYFRPPAGTFDRSSLLKVRDLGYTTFFWSLAYKDWETNNQRGAGFAYNSVMNNIHNGAIILMHTVSTDNLEALPRIIDDLRAKGYVIENLDHLIYQKLI